LQAALVLDRTAVALSVSYLPLVVLAAFGVLVFFLLLATLQTPDRAQSIARLLTTLAVSLAVVGMFWLASRR
jgi:hypothetical protein